MLIWDIIRDWFVMNIWGGLTSDLHAYAGFIGSGAYVPNIDDIERSDLMTSGFMVPIKDCFNADYDIYVSYISLGDWLSTTSTIIVLVAISVGLYFLTRYFFRMFAGLLSGR